MSNKKKSNKKKLTARSIWVGHEKRQLSTLWSNYCAILSLSTTLNCWTSHVASCFAVRCYSTIYAIEQKSKQNNKCEIKNQFYKNENQIIEQFGNSIATNTRRQEFTHNFFSFFKLVNSPVGIVWIRLWFNFSSVSCVSVSNERRSSRSIWLLFRFLCDQNRIANRNQYFSRVTWHVRDYYFNIIQYVSFAELTFFAEHFLWKTY